eukprot:1429664-Amphidinium_carterae.1
MERTDRTCSKRSLMLMIVIAFVLPLAFGTHGQVAANALHSINVGAACPWQQTQTTTLVTLLTFPNLRLEIARVHEHNGIGQQVYVCVDWGLLPVVLPMVESWIGMCIIFSEMLRLSCRWCADVDSLTTWGIMSSVVSGASWLSDTSAK